MFTHTSDFRNEDMIAVRYVLLEPPSMYHGALDCLLGRTKTRTLRCTKMLVGFSYIDSKLFYHLKHTACF